MNYKFLFYLCVFNIVVSDLSAQCRTSDSLQLVALYNATNGANWKDKTNWLTAKPIDTWHGVLVENDCVTLLSLNNNGLIGTLPTFVFSNLESLYLSLNQLRGSLTLNTPKLTLLDLNNNQLTGSIPNFDASLTYLDLSNNKFSGSIPNFDMPNLTELILFNNELSGAIPDFKLPNLKRLMLHSNNLVGNVPNFNLSNLTAIHLSRNRLSGSIPIFNTPNLEWLILSNNLLTGSVPDYQYPKLRYLDLAANKLTGQIPNFNLPNLRMLVLRINHLTGNIPKFNTPFLEQLLLDGNKLTGTIPNFAYPNMILLELYDNKLTGSIPYFKLSNLIGMNLYNNQLEGCIPTSLKENCPKLGANGATIDGNPKLSTQNWSKYWYQEEGSCPILVSKASEYSIRWTHLETYPNGSTTTQPSIELTVCIEFSDSVPVVACTLFKNGQQIIYNSNKRRLGVTRCRNSFNFAVTLDEGSNKFYLITDSNNGNLRSDTFNIIHRRFVQTKNLAVERRLALVTANAAYQYFPLKNAIHDASDVADSLRKIGFKVLLDTNMDYKRMNNLLNDFNDSLNSGNYGLALFYFAGHGSQVNGEYYLIPLYTTYMERDTLAALSAQRLADTLKREYISLKRILNLIEDATKRYSIVILDACRNNPYQPFDEQGKIESIFQTEVDSYKKGRTLICFSTFGGSTASDGWKRNSPYTGCLLKNLLNPDLSLMDLFTITNGLVQQETNGEQIPWISASLSEVIYLGRHKK